MSFITVFGIIAVLLVVSIVLQIIIVCRVGGTLDEILTILEEDKDRDEEKKDSVVSDPSSEENADVINTISIVRACKLRTIEDKRDDATTTSLFNYLYGINGYRLDRFVIHSADELMDYIKDNRLIYDIRCNKFRVVRRISTYGSYTLLLECDDGNTITFLAECFAKVEANKSEIQRIA